MEHQDSSDADQFIRDRIETVPHLESLLLLWNGREQGWRVEEMAERLFLAPEAAREILDDLVRQDIGVAHEGSLYRYVPEAARDRVMAAVDLAYRRDLIRITRLIHSKPSTAIRAFAQAFRFKKERD